MDPRSSCSLLYRTCSLVVVLCALHISIMLVFCLRDTGTESDHAHRHRHVHRIPQPRGASVRMNTRIATTVATTTDQQELERCPEVSPLLVGAVRVDFSQKVNLTEVKHNPQLSDGGRYKPRECVSLHKVAIIIPFRHREQHLEYWLYNLHPVLQRQQLEYTVYVIQQDGEDIFNRAKLLNVGYIEALKNYDYECFVFSDVDLIPLDDRNLYHCFEQPRHLAVSMDKFGYRLPYNQYFGGACAMSKEQFLKINGFPNNYWGWGGEDDDIYNRLSFRGMSISRPDAVIGRCKMLRHERDRLNEPNPKRFDQIAHTRETMGSDGINSLSYRVVKIEKDKLFTRIIVDIGKP
ncbi:beta-1,4-galactosyltransferase 1-like isoform X1 [Hoplias malabaricus]|uniref:beta-1,4-galactosyltransferase 1-like isoform X1 n=1 Tax=Hoplias malabaricus TaxID=27720 RepID=UPI0034631D32